ncbi:MAG: NADH-quinone oxidoreductase subunit C [Gammaproteobacteria bacterium]
MAAPLQTPQLDTWQSLARDCVARWAGVTADTDHDLRIVHIVTPHDVLRPLCLWLFKELDYRFGTLVVEEQAECWQLTYVFMDPSDHGWVYIEMTQSLTQTNVASIGDEIHAADWHEREAEDLFGLHFEGHPKLGEFVLHEDWPEGVNPMRKRFDMRQPLPERNQVAVWQPPTIVQAPGAFAMPVGPVYSDFAEAAHFVIETTGENMLRVLPRFFYKYRGVEKLAEEKTIDEALLLAERFSGSNAFAHGWAFCRAIESLCATEPPARASALRTAFAELERLRQHVATITGLCGATGLSVAQAQGAILEEELLRLTAEICGHRYLFGLLTPGGLTLDMDNAHIQRFREGAQDIRARLEVLQTDLRYSSSFLDRIEEVGIITADVVKAFGLVGPVARASGEPSDMRKLFCYGAYANLEFEVPVETEGDGYARLRILFREAQQSVAIIEQALSDLPTGPLYTPLTPRGGASLGCVEAPLGAAYHWLRLDDAGRIQRYRIGTPSFRNWHAFRVAVEGFSFQDFPIILATFGLSQAESDR